MKNKVILILLSVVAFSQNCYALGSQEHINFLDHGGGSTGGGNTCIIDNKPVILDFITHPQGQTLLDINSKLGVHLKEVQRPNQVKRIELKNLKIYSDIKKLIYKKLSKSPLLRATLNIALDGMTIFASDKISMPARKATFTNECNKENTRLTILYSSSLLIIDVPTFNQHSYTSQIGLIIHELLRQMQIRYSGAGNDEDLQELTSLIVLSNKTMNLDNHVFVKDFVNNFSTKMNISMNNTSEIQRRLHSINNLFDPTISELDKGIVSKKCLEKAIRYLKYSVASFIYSNLDSIDKEDIVMTSEDAIMVARIDVRTCTAVEKYKRN